MAECCWNGMVWQSVVWYSMVWQSVVGIVRCSRVLCGIVQYGRVLCASPVEVRGWEKWQLESNFLLTLQCNIGPTPIVLCLTHSRMVVLNPSLSILHFVSYILRQSNPFCSFHLKSELFSSSVQFHLSHRVVRKHCPPFSPDQRLSIYCTTFFLTYLK